MLRTYIHSQSIGLFCFGLAACGAGPDETAYEQTAQGLGAITTDPNGGEINALFDAVVAARGNVPDGLLRESAERLSGTRDELVIDLQLSSANVHIEQHGRVDGEMFKLDIVRKSDFETALLAEDITEINGTSELTIKAEYKDKTNGEKDKLAFDYDARYRDVLVREDGAVIGGKIEYDVKAKLMEKTDDTKIKESWKIDALVEFDGSGEPSLTLDGRHKYRIKSHGEVADDS